MGRLARAKLERPIGAWPSLGFCPPSQCPQHSFVSLSAGGMTRMKNSTGGNCVGWRTRRVAGAERSSAIHYPEPAAVISDRQKRRVSLSASPRLSTGAGAEMAFNLCGSGVAQGSSFGIADCKNRQSAPARPSGPHLRHAEFTVCSVNQPSKVHPPRRCGRSVHHAPQSAPCTHPRQGQDRLPRPGLASGMRQSARWTYGRRLCG